MKRRIIILLIGILFCLTSQSQTWSEWFNQKKTQRKYLLQQIAKLKVYLEYARKGYSIAQEGLTLIGDIKNGDFNLHRFFFDRLKQVSPVVKKYSKVGDIISMQQKMLKAYQSQFPQLRESTLFTSAETDYITSVYSGLFDALATDIESLTNILTNGEYEMHDNERLKRIDELHLAVTRKYSAFFSFTNQLIAIAKNKQQELKDIQHLQKLY